MNNFWFIVIAVILMLPGLVGVIVPALPGVPFMLVVAIGYAWLTHFAKLTGVELAILTGITALTVLVDYLAGTLGARFGGASARSTIIGIIGMIVGLVILPGVGGIIGLFLGIFLSEYLRHQDQSKAARAATGGLIGSLAGIILNLILAIIFIITFVILAR